MSAIDIFKRSGSAANAGPAGFVREIAARLRRYNSYHRTLAELDNLSDRELYDLGLSRHQIRSVAYREAYGS
ncbi:MAG: DUF1127 domain-containing protein [Boseongicola sp.]